MNYARIVFVLLSLATASPTALAQSPPQADVTDVKNGPAILAELKALKGRGKLTDAEVQRLRVIKQQTEKNWLTHSVMPTAFSGLGALGRGRQRTQLSSRRAYRKGRHRDRGPYFCKTDQEPDGHGDDDLADRLRAGRFLR
ncbi:hypothetical protein [Bradyrhizobium sp. NAS80.1]|uniref:hypothetical protein n=1 Tax=Bradyrhizobium sp. NAS80.1 TaxID=1680159 RepID=UPI0011614B60|nr:hypothetical protein [Bradyrhizobium sp. NAS80.1]